MATQPTDLRSLLAGTTVVDAMTHGVVMCGAETRLPVMAAAMAGQGIHAIVVPSPHGGSALTISDLDLVRAELRGTSEQTAGDIALEPMATVAPTATVRDAIERMATLDVAHLLVGDAGEAWPDGILSSFDVVSVLSGRDPRADADGALRAGAASGERHPAAGHHRRARHDPRGDRLPARHADARAGGAHGRHARPLHRGLGRRHAARQGRAPHVGARDPHGRHPRRASRRARDPAGELAATPIALPEDATLERAATLMADHDVAHVVAVGPSGLPSGVVSTLDVIAVLAAGAPARDGLIA